MRIIKVDDYGRGKVGIDLFYVWFFYVVSDVVVFVMQNFKIKGYDFFWIFEWVVGVMFKIFN